MACPDADRIRCAEGEDTECSDGALHRDGVNCSSPPRDGVNCSSLLRVTSWLHSPPQKPRDCTSGCCRMIRSQRLVQTVRVSDRLSVGVLKVLRDNYAYVVIGGGGRHRAVVDPGDRIDLQPAPTAIWLTHHHDDHVGGVVDLGPDIPVWAAFAGRHVPFHVEHSVRAGQTFAFGSDEVGQATKCQRGEPP